MKLHYSHVTHGGEIGFNCLTLVIREQAHIRYCACPELESFQQWLQWPEVCRRTFVLQFCNDIWQELLISICYNDLAGIQRRIPERIQIELISYLQEIRAQGDGYGAGTILTSWA